MKIYITPDTTVRIEFFREDDSLCFSVASNLDEHTYYRGTTDLAARDQEAAYHRFYIGDDEITLDNHPSLYVLIHTATWGNNTFLFFNNAQEKNNIPSELEDGAVEFRCDFSFDTGYEFHKTVYATELTTTDYTTAVNHCKTQMQEYPRGVYMLRAQDFRGIGYIRRFDRFTEQIRLTPKQAPKHQLPKNFDVNDFKSTPKWGA